MLRELVPTAKRVAVLVNPTNAAETEAAVREVEAAARAMGLQIKVLNASTSGEIDAAFAILGRERPDALFVGQDGFSVVGDFNLPTWRRVMQSPRHPVHVTLPRSAAS